VWIALLHEIGAAVIFALGIADGGGSGMEEGGSGGGGNVLAEGGKEGSAVVGMQRKSSHELRSVLTDLHEWIKCRK
jgi:hypothetical protein